MPSVTATATAMTSSHATGSISLKSQSPIRVDTRVPITEVLSNAPSLLHAQSLQHLLTESAIQPTSPVDTSASPTISVHARSEAAIPPLPGARIPGDLLENYSLITPAWESEPGSGTSSPSMTEFEMGNSYDSHPRQSDSARDFQQNRSLHHSDLCPSPHRNATNSSTPALSRHHPYPAHARQRYHASHLSATPHQDSPDRRHHPFLYYPSASAPRHPDVDPDDGADDFEVLEREPVVKKVVAMIRDTLVGLNEILDASGAESASAIRRRAKGKGRAYPAAHNASTSRYASTAGFGTLSASTTLRRDEATESGSSTGADTILAQLGGEGEILDEMRSLVRESMELKEEKVEQQEEMRRLRLEVEDLRKQVLLMGGQQKHTVPSTAFPKDEVPIHDLVSSASSPPYDPERGRSPSVHPSAHIDRTRRGPRESFVSSVSNPASSHPPAPEPKLVDDDGSIHSPPWTPDKEDPSHHVQIDSVPLPVKSQRKHRLMQVSKMENQD
ncbi:hypothetical protein DXG03_002936 [Asterophora parasitica]|uniref:Uncharacterized protein n=1 Tax=Asterophora parasitica TaxID=117018 RepID=A0A9P7G5A3_9AGAR|nr:hypothetical protein DXG03_002936 [Asterophora parasitica]